MGGVIPSGGRREEEAGRVRAGGRVGCQEERRRRSSCFRKYREEYFEKQSGGSRGRCGHLSCLSVCAGVHGFDEEEGQCGRPRSPFGYKLCGNVYLDGVANVPRSRGRSVIPARAIFCRNVYGTSDIGQGCTCVTEDAMRCQMSASCKVNVNARRPSRGEMGGIERMMTRGCGGTGARMLTQRWRATQGTTTRQSGHGLTAHEHGARMSHPRSTCCEHGAFTVIGTMLVDDGDAWAFTEPLHPPCSTTRRSRRRADARRQEDEEGSAARDSLGDGATMHDECDGSSVRRDGSGGMGQGCDERAGGIGFSSATYSLPCACGIASTDDARRGCSTAPTRAFQCSPGCVGSSEGVRVEVAKSGLAVTTEMGNIAAERAPRSGGGRGRPRLRALRQGEHVGSRRRARGPAERRCIRKHREPREVRRRGGHGMASCSGARGGKQSNMVNLAFISAARVMGGRRCRWPRGGARCTKCIVVIRKRQCATRCGCRRGPSRNMLIGDAWAPSGKPLLRYGEATNPGPQRAQQKEGALELDYRDPTQEGFWGAMLPGADIGGREGKGESTEYQLLVDTCNGTSWSSVARFLTKTRADIVLVQEHHLGPSQVAAASKWAGKRGWQTVWSAAERGEGEGWRAGVCICARAPVALSMPRRGGAVVCEARVVSAVAEAPGYGPIALYSVYLRDGEGLSRANLGILAALGNHVERLGPNTPFIVGGDFQMPPSRIAAAGLAEKVHAVIAASGNPKGTCRTARSRSNIDYFYVANGLANGVQSIRTVEATNIKTHVPVRLALHPRVTSARTLIIRKPPRIPAKRVYGPVPPPPDWGRIREWAEDLAGRAKEGDYEEIMTEFSALHAEWADTAERELEDVTGVVVPKAGLRGRCPKLVWRSIVPEKRHQNDGDRADVCRWIMTMAHDLRKSGEALARSLTSVADDLISDGRNGDVTVDEPGAEWARAQAIEAADEVNDLLIELRSPPVAVSAALEEDDGGDGSEARDLMDLIEKAAEQLRGMLEDLFADTERQAEQGAVEVWDIGAYEIYGRACALAEKAEDDRRKTEKQAWLDWIRHNVDAGARNAHRFLQLPVEWHPTEVLTEDGIVTADPMSILDAYSRKYDGMWADECDDGDFVNDAGGWGRRCALELPEPEVIRSAAAQFKEETLTTYDGFHPRHYGLLCDEALAVVGNMVIVAELMGALPRELRLLTMPMIPKPRKGHRAVAAFVSLYRLWAKIRKPHIEKWEAAHDRHYLAAGKDRSPQDTVWRQAARAEAAVGDGDGVAATLLWDMKSFFERLDRRKLRRRIMALDFPLPIARLAMAAYSGPRMLSMTGALAKPVYAWRGVAAGCGVAVALTRVYYIPPFDHMVDDYRALFRNVLRFDAFFDDLGLGATGTRSEVEHALVEGQIVLADVIERELNCEIEIDKAAVVASDRALAKSLVKRIGKRSGGLKAAAPNLGIDFAPGRARSAQAKGGKRSGRLRGLARKLIPFRRLCKVLGGKASKIFVAGPLPFATYGSAVNGMSDQEVLRLRRAMATAWSPRARGRSLKMVTLLNRAPTHSAENNAAYQYCREVWRAAALGASLPTRGEFTLSGIAEVWRAVDQGKYIDCKTERRRWNSSRGPIANLFMTLHRIGWKMVGPFTMVTDRGDEIPLTAYSPILIKQLMHEATLRGLERQLGESMHKSGCEGFRGRRVCLDHVRSRLSSDRRMSPLEKKAAYRSVLCDAVLTRSKAAERGYLVDDVCPLCGARGDSIFHRVWECCHPEVEAARRKSAPDWMIDEAKRRGRHDPLYLKGLFPHPGDVWPRPEDQGRLHFYRAEDECRVPEADVCDAACEALAKKVDEWRANPEELVTEFVASAVRDTPEMMQFNGGASIKLGGRLYVDGSCTQHVFQELRRAASALVVRQPGGGVEARYLLPVWAPLPQTPQAAEYLAPVAPLKHVASHTVIVSDCLNVVRDFGRRERAAASARTRYAGLLKHVLGMEVKEAVVVVKTKAHRNVASVPPGLEREDAIGNAAADRAAKEAVRLHPQPTPAQEGDLAAACRRAAIAIRTIGATMAVFPPLPKDRMQRHPPNREGAGVMGDGGHDWIFAQNLWRCRLCHRCTVKPRLDPGLVHAKCPGRKAARAIPRMADHGHDVVFTGGDMPILFCARCGAFSWRREYGLSSSCPRKPTPAGSQALARIRRGQLPWINRGEAHLPRRSIDMAGGGVWCEQNRVMVNFNGHTEDSGWHKELEDGGAGTTSLGEVTGDIAMRDAGVHGVAKALEIGCGPVYDVGGGDVSDYDEADVFGHGGSLDADGVSGTVRPELVAEEMRQGADGRQGQILPGQAVGPRYQEGGSSSSSSGSVGGAVDDGAISSTGRGCAIGDMHHRGGGQHGCIVAANNELGQDDVEAEAGSSVGNLGAVANNVSAKAEGVGARAGPGGPCPSHSTDATVTVLSAVAVASVVGGHDRVDQPQLDDHARVAAAARGKSTRGPPSGCAEPLDSSKDMVKRRRMQYSPQVSPQKLGVGPSNGLAVGDEDGDWPADMENARRREGTDSPTRVGAVARHGDVATVPCGWKRPETGRNASHVQSARQSECQELPWREDHGADGGEAGGDTAGQRGRASGRGRPPSTRCSGKLERENAGGQGTRRSRCGRDGGVSDVRLDNAAAAGSDIGGERVRGGGAVQRCLHDAAAKRRRTQKEDSAWRPGGGEGDDHCGDGLRRRVWQPPVRALRRADREVHRLGGSHWHDERRLVPLEVEQQRFRDGAVRESDGEGGRPRGGGVPTGTTIDPIADADFCEEIIVSDGRSEGDGRSMGAEWGSPHAAPPPARADRGGDHGGAGAAPHAAPRPRRDHRPRDRRGRVDAGTGQEDTYKLEEGLAEWVRRWGSAPAWLYLPHLEGRRGEDEAGGTHAARRDEVSRPANGGDGASELDSANGAARRSRIRGRGNSPGPSSSGTRGAAVAEGQRADAEIRGPLNRPGPTGARFECGAKVKASELEAWLQRSKAERAARSNGRNGEGARCDGPTAAERMAALRRRVSARAAEAGGVAADSIRYACMGPVGATASTEDEKMHLNRRGRIREEDPTFEPVAMVEAEAERQSSGGGSARAAVPSSDAEQAAQRVAWHAVEDSLLTNNRGAG